MEAIYLGILFWGFISSKALPSGELGALEFSNVVTIPDIHGDSKSLLYSLWISLVDLEGSSIQFLAFNQAFDDAHKFPSVQRDLLSSNPTDTVLIQLGDIFDRGPNGLACLKIVEMIERVIGWKTLRLYGNHELMNHMGTQADYLHPADSDKFSELFGITNRQAAFSLGGSVWRSITDSTLLMVRISAVDGGATELQPLDSPSTLFVHGGIETHWVDEVREKIEEVPGTLLIDAINRLTQEVFTASIKRPPIDLFSSYGGFTIRQSPLWIRDLTELNSDYVCDKVVPSILKYFNVARLVVGHTPQLKMVSMCNSRIVLADASMSRWMRQYPWTKNDETGSPQIDAHGRPILGQPCALIMQSYEGEVGVLKAIYFDLETGKKSQDMFYPFSGTDFPREGRTAPTGIRPVQFNSPPLGKPGPMMMQTQAIAQQLSDKSAVFVDILQQSDLRHMFGIPEVLHFTDSKVVVYDTFGEGLTGYIRDRNSAIMLPIVRQVLEILKDLDDLGVWLGDYESLPDLFLIEAGSGLVKLVDFSILKFRERWTYREPKVAQICSDLLQIGGSSVFSDYVNYWTVASQIFPDLDWERFNNRMGPQIAAPIESRADISDSALWLEKPMMREESSSSIVLPGLIDDDVGENLTDLPFALALNSPEQTLGVMRKRLIAHLGKGEIYLATTLFGRERILLHLTAKRVRSAHLAIGVLPIRGEEEMGADGDLYLLFNHGGELLSQEVIAKMNSTQQKSIAEVILQQAEELHRAHILLGVSPKWTPDKLLSFFVWDSQRLHLVDISRLSKEIAAWTCSDEMKLIVDALQKLFSIAITEDTGDDDKLETGFDKLQGDENSSLDSWSPRTTRENSIADDDSLFL